MSRKNKDVFSEVVVGIFMVVVLVILGYFTIVISGVDVLMGRARTNVTIAFSDVGGLKERDNVIYRGMKVGTVEQIALAPSNITVTVNIDSDVILRTSYHITVSAVSLLGGNHLVLEEGRGAELPLATTVFRGEPPADWMRDLGAIARKLNDLTEGGELHGIITNVEETTKNVNAIVARVERGEGMVGKLLSSDERAYDDLTATIAAAKSAATNVEAVAARVQRGEGTLGRLLSKEDEVYADIRKTMANAADISSRIAAGDGTLGKLMSTNDTVYADLKSAVAGIREATDSFKNSLSKGEGVLSRALNDKTMADDAAKLLENLKTVSARLAEGEGTLGKLASDQEMYNEVNALVKDVRQIVDNYRDTTPVSTFGSLIMGGL